VTGLGSIAANGCHLLAFMPAREDRIVGSGVGCD